MDQLRALGVKVGAPGELKPNDAKGEAGDAASTVRAFLPITMMNQVAALPFVSFIALYPHAGQGGYGEPECVYCPRPSFSDEAVKLKYEGSVYLRIVVTKDGRATNIQVIKGLGAGLAQKAVDAVRKWRFKPAVGPDGNPTAVVVEVRVDFHIR